MIKLAYRQHNLEFKFEARTSRGSLFTKQTIYITLLNTENNKKGFGEISIIEGLSTESLKATEDALRQIAAIEHDEASIKNAIHTYQSFSGLCFALETALMDLQHGGVQNIFDNDFYSRKLKIPINGLIWMGEKDFLKAQITAKLELGFKCLKMKVGALDFNQELEVLTFIRKHFGKDDLILRVDANGGFKPKNALEKLNTLAQFDLHSIEQPIAVNQWEIMNKLCSETPIPIALDEELIPLKSLSDKAKLLNLIKPQYIILKPGIMGGFLESSQWIKVANAQKIGWWITSALESNIGLNAISQYACQLNAIGHQGLGTGQLFHNNVQSPLTLASEYIYYEKEKTWDLSAVDSFK